MKPIIDPVAFFHKVARYTRFVVFTKFGLLLVSTCLVAYMVMKASWNGEESKYSLVFSNIEVGEGGASKMIKPRLQGTDTEGRPYNILGEYAVQPAQNQVSIHKVQGDMTLKDGSWATIMAETGDFDTTTMKAHLVGDVSLFHDSGYEFHSENVYADMKAKRAYSETPVEGQGLLGNLVADKFSMDTAEAVLRFDGNVKVTIYTQGRKK